jgi:hypothetical protein
METVGGAMAGTDITGVIGAAIRDMGTAATAMMTMTMDIPAATTAAGSIARLSGPAAHTGGGVIARASIEDTIDRIFKS